MAIAKDRRRDTMTKAQAARVIDATVRIDGKGGQGVLVPGGFILTATHCIEWRGEGGMTLGDYHIEKITTKSGTHLKVGPLAADPISDLAVLGPLDNQEFFDECEQFEQWCEATSPVLVANTTPRFRIPLAVKVLTHTGKWICARIIRYSPGPPHGSLCLEADDYIEGGTSGGPVVDFKGRLVGVVSQSGEDAIKEKSVGLAPIVRLALPQWAWLAIRAAAARLGEEKMTIECPNCHATQIQITQLGPDNTYTTLCSKCGPVSGFLVLPTEESQESDFGKKKPKGE